MFEGVEFHILFGQKDNFDQVKHTQTEKVSKKPDQVTRPQGMSQRQAGLDRLYEFQFR